MGVQLKGKEPGRNEPCSCESGLKYKCCHGDVLKKAVCNRIVMEKMVELIREEKIRKGLLCKHGVAINEHCSSCKIED